MAKSNNESSDAVEGEELDIVDSNALAIVTRQEIDLQIATAHRFPRVLAQCINEARSMATLNQETAESTFYKLPRKKDGEDILIEGPSIRLAEIMQSAWGNMRVVTRIVEIGEKRIKAQAVAIDLQKNNGVAEEITRNIWGKRYGRFSEDMITMTCNAASSIARRNAIYRVIPRCYVDDILASAKKVAIGDASTLERRRDIAIAYFTQKVGVPLDRVLYAIGCGGIADITLDKLETLTGFKTAIADNVERPDVIFPPIPVVGQGADMPGDDAAAIKAAEAGGKAAKLAERLNKSKAPTDADKAKAAAEAASVAKQATSAASMSAGALDAGATAERIDEGNAQQRDTVDADSSGNGVPDNDDAPFDTVQGGQGDDGPRESHEPIEPSVSMSDTQFVNWLVSLRPEAAGDVPSATALAEKRMRVFLPKKWAACDDKQKQQAIDRVLANQFPWQ